MNKRYRPLDSLLVDGYIPMGEYQLFCSDVIGYYFWVSPRFRLIFIFILFGFVPPFGGSSIINLYKINSTP